MNLKEHKYDETARNLLNLRKKSEFFQLPETELLYDYGDKSKKSRVANPWLAK
jgi:hypothetical protein